MATTTVWISKQTSDSRTISGIATIDINETDTLTIPCGGRSVVRLGLPTLTSTTITFTAQLYQGGTFRTLTDAAGNTITIPATTGGITLEIPELSGIYAFTIVCGSSQAAARAIDVQMTGPNANPAGGRIQVTGGGGASSIGKAEDSVATSGDVGVPALGVRANTAAAAAANGDYVWTQMDGNGAVWQSLATLIAGEDQTNNRLMTMPSYSYSAPVVVDTQVKAGAGVLHSITIAQNDAAPTAGTIEIRDSLTAGAGTVIFSWTLTTAVFLPFNLVLDVAFTTGLYIDFTTTGDVNVSAAYL